MATRSLGTLTLDLVARIGGFIEGLDKASRESQKRMKEIRKEAEIAGKALAGFGLAGVAGMAALAVSTVRTAGEIRKLAQISGASAEEFQRYAAGAKAVGIEQDKLGDIFKDVQDKVGDFLNTGGGALADFFENIAPQVGVTADEFRKLSGPQALGLYVDSLEKAGASQQDMTFYLEAIASDATALLPLLKNNAEGFKALGDAAAESGAILDDQTIRSANELQAITLLTTQTLDGLKNQLVSGLLPTLSGLSGALFDVSTDTEIARNTGEAFGGILKGMAATAFGAYSAVQLLGKSVGALGAAFSAAGVEGDDLLLGPLAPLVVSGKVAKNIDAFRNALNIGFSDVSADVEKYAETLDNIWKAGAGGGSETDYAKRVKAIADLLEEARKAAGSSGAVFKKNADEMKAAEDAAKKLADEVEALARATKVYELVKSGLTPDEARYRVELEYASELTRETLKLTRATELLGKEQEESAERAKAALDEIARASEASAEQMRRAYERSAEAIEGVFRDLYRSAFDGFEGFEESLKASFENLLVELALIATRNAIIIPVVTSVGGALGLPQQAIGGITGALGLGDSGIGSIFGSGGGVAFGQTAATAILNSAYDFADITGAEWAYSLADTLGDPRTFAGLTTVLNNLPGLFAAGSALFAAGSGLAVPGSRVSGDLQGLGAVLAPAFALPATLLDNLTGGGLFGTRWQTVGQELAISITDQIADATLLTLRERERSFFRGTRRSTEEDAARGLDRQLSEAFGLIFDSISAGAERIGLAAGDFSFQFNESIAGLTEEEVGAVIEGALSDAADAFIRQTIPGIEAMRAAGETLQQTFQRVVVGFDVVQSAIEMFGLSTAVRQSANEAADGVNRVVLVLSLGATTAEEMAAAYDRANPLVEANTQVMLGAVDALTELAGGAQQLQANISNFWSDFATDEQQAARTAELVGRLFESLGLTLPETREGVFDLVQGLDIFTESGREAFNAITASSGLLDAYFDNLERGAEGALEASEQLRAELERQNFDSGVLRAIERMGLSGEALAQFDLQQEFEAMIAEAERVGGDLAAVEEYFGLRRLAITEQFLQEELDLREQSFGRAIDDLRRFQDELRFGSFAALTPERQYEVQRQRFEETSALASLGDVEALANLAGVGRAFLDASRANFATSGGYFADLDRVNSAVGSGIDAAQFEIDVGQQQLNALNTQISQGTQMQEVVYAAAKAVEQLAAKQEQDREVQRELLVETRALARSTTEANKVNSPRIARIEEAVADIATEARFRAGQPRAK